ncbi:Putative HTH-type transcriptional regulator YvdT [Macrococcoides canis]|uniref:Putative HTH-type transcriptional regulator YvdT n=1 Tax=Macrococcoides canis TaxID=1855823 RepID=A0A1W7AE23_9STAP|nr:TetR/AcrR family transcriptional regulator [Macrococcus canis]ARQ07380.1 putative HTH-type transcriptional regulator YvdT [Macrococcus canis]
MDKRFERSEKLIRKSFIELLSNKSHQKISVSDICRKAGCSRNTFYLHYDSKDHLIAEIMDEIIQSIEESCRPVVKDFNSIGITESKIFTDQILKAVNEQRSFIKVLINQQHWNFSKRLSEVMLASNIKEAEAINQQYNFPHLIYFTNGVVGYINYWLQTDLSLDEAQIELNEAVNFKFR